MKKYLFACLLSSPFLAFSQTDEQMYTGHPPGPVNHSILSVDGAVPYLPVDSSMEKEKIVLTKNISFTPTVNFFFRPEVTFDYKEAAMPVDTSHLNFYLRGDFGGIISLPRNIDMVFNFQSYGVYTRVLGPLDKNISFYEGYADIKGRNASVRFGRMNLGKYGNELLVGDDDFTRGRSFESIRLRLRSKKRTSDVMWVQMYQTTVEPTGTVQRHPVFLGSFNTINFSPQFNLDANLPVLIDQHKNNYHTSMLMPDVRIYGQVAQIKYSAELIYQFGWSKAVADKSIKGNVNAYATELSAGYFSRNDNFCADATFYRASGDDNPADGDFQSYNTLWQNNHRRFGFSDVFLGSNVQAITLHTDMKIAKRLNLGMHAVYASVVEKLDKSTGVATAASLAALNLSSNAIGAGADVYLNFFASRYFNFQVVTAVFSPGDYLKTVSALDKTMFRFYLVGAVRLN